MTYERMTYEHAVAIRTSQLNGRYISPELLQRAIDVIRTTPRTPTRIVKAGEKRRVTNVNQPKDNT
jgi:hypothetical protein